MRILIAEDDAVSRRVLQAFLQKWGFEVVAATDGEAAWHILEQEDAPRLAVLDWMMPGLAGIEVCRRVRARLERPYVYMLLLTARGQKEDLLEGMKFGADDYISKPFDPKELQARLHVGQRIVQLQDELITAREALRFQATHDFLTGARNRAEILETLRRELARSRREGSAVGVILLDLDHFKRVNDTWGHLAGDAVLQEAVKRLNSCVREYDAIGRYGGEEFLIVTPATDSMGALGQAERIRACIEATPFETPAGRISVTASLGVAATDLLLVAKDQASVNPQVLLAAADSALYRAKDQGRNRADVATTSEIDGIPSVLTPAADKESNGASNQTQKSPAEKL
jgi:two-component system cell cycle response regulator